MFDIDDPPPKKNQTKNIFKKPHRPKREAPNEEA
jgi:hypothetical protein